MNSISRIGHATTRLEGNDQQVPYANKYKVNEPTTKITVETTKYTPSHTRNYLKIPLLVDRFSHISYNQYSYTFRVLPCCAYVINYMFYGVEELIVIM